ncbi:pyridoxal-phosphate dependent enzyme [Actinomarinicola tropica]|uniref:Pyridoxal-phosphate dependent enzyme n=1 Tax=Actinomarinicola tropica TaxID=2789776 RepID=A0A5Q2RI41_9ACTN|nr:pyridoxal-phosphate dependent enzyme [Actinomarinicola tropica]QGG96459.1 pyridoxal-phosphate dependent enzyme [Actinomarinicola tropica]
MTDRTPPAQDDAVLRCRECGHPAPADGPQYCDRCFGPVEVVLSTPPGPGVELRGAVDAGPTTVARWAPLLPGGLDLVGAAAGGTPLRSAPGLAADLGVAEVWLKDETANPTGSFKDRVVDVAIARGVATGRRVVACSSTGNLARAVAAGAARRGLAAVVLVPAALEADRVDLLVRLGAHVVRVDGGYDDASRAAAEAASELHHWSWVNVNLRPWYELGARTTGWEVVRQLGWMCPDRIVAPMASGALARALHDGVAHLLDLGLVDGPPPRLTVAQPAGCAPVAAAFDAGATVVRPVRPGTAVASLAMGDPPDGDAVLAAARATGGAVVAVDEDAVGPATARLHARGGLSAELAGGVVLAGLEALAARGELQRHERVVAVVTGAAAWAPPAELVSPAGANCTIEPSVGALIEALPPEITRA